MATMHIALQQRLALAAALLIVCPASGCDSLRNWHGDESANPEYVLKIEIPPTATDVNTQFDPAVSYEVKFLMPNAQWRDYATTYYPADKLTATPIARSTNTKVPSMCPPRDGVRLTEWSSSDRISFMRSTDITAPRFLWVVPDCRPDQTYVHWMLIPPKATSPSPSS